MESMSTMARSFYRNRREDGYSGENFYACTLVVPKTSPRKSLVRSKARLGVRVGFMLAGNNLFDGSASVRTAVREGDMIHRGDECPGAEIAVDRKLTHEVSTGLSRKYVDDAQGRRGRADDAPRAQER
jgi:hypothetical protein